MDLMLSVLAEVENTRWLGLNWNRLMIIGFIGNAVFSTRFIIQWIASEKKKESVIPVSFWYVSIVGTLVMLLYFILEGNPVGILAYLPNTAVYIRNLHLIQRKKVQSNPAGLPPVNSPQL